MDLVWFQVQILDKTIQLEQAFKVVKEDANKGKDMISQYLDLLCVISRLVEPFMPETSEKIISILSQNKKPETPLFLRRE